MITNITLCKRYEWRGTKWRVDEKIKIEIEFLNQNLNLPSHIGYPPPITKRKLKSNLDWKLKFEIEIWISTPDAKRNLDNHPL